MATQAELEQGYNDFVSAMTSGNFGEAANVAAGLGFSPAETEAFIEANAPGLGFDPGTDIPSDVVADYFGGAGGAGGTTTTTGGVTQSAAERAAEDKAVLDFVDRFQQGDPTVPIPYAVWAGALYRGDLSQDAISRVTGADLGFITTQNTALNQIQPSGYSDAQVAVWFLDNPKGANESQSDFETRIFNAMQASGVGIDQVSRVTGADPGYVGTRYEEIDKLQLKPPPLIPKTDLKEEEGAGTSLTSIPRQERQTPSMISFAPPRRGLAQLRPAAFMPGLLEGTPGFGGSGFTPESLREANTGLSAADRAYLMDVGGVSAAELAAATGIPMGQLQAEYNQNRPQGLFSSVSPQTGPTFKDTSQLGAFNLAIAQGDFERGAQIAQAAGFSPQEAEYYINANLSGLNQAQPVAPGTIGSLYGPNAPTPPGLALQTGAFGATIPTTVAIPQPSSSTAPQPGSTFDEQMSYLANMYLGRPLTAPEMATYRTDFGSELNQANITDFLNRSQQEMANRLLVGTNPGAATNNPLALDLARPSAMDAVSNLASKAGTNIREGGVIKMAEGGMPRLSAEEAGSTFDSSEFVDEQGRLVGGYNRPIYEDNVLVDYEFVPYGRNVVFGEELRERESQGSSSDELEMAMRAMLARQGRTGVSPTMGGLPGIMAREAVMRRRPEYYNFAEGGLASVAQDLADKGRFGDTMVAHISPQEAGILKALGGAGTINPETGLPEYFSLFPKKGISLNFGPLGKVKFGKKSSDLIQAAAALYAGSYLPGGLEANLGKTALAYGGVRGAATGNLMEGIQAGLTAYGMGNLYTSFGPGAATTGAPPVVENTGSLAGGTAGVDAGVVGSQNVPIESGVGFENAMSGAELEPFMRGGPLPGPEIITPTPTGGFYGKMPLDAGTAATQAGTEAAKQGFLERTLPAGVKEYTPKFLLDASGPTLATGTVLGGSLIAGGQERSAAAAQQAALNREQEERKKRYRDLFAQTLGQIPVRAAGGGLMSLAGGGMTYMEAGGTTGPTGVPRDVTGTGDGMSDSVPATIEGVQEARLADGEFVIPADVVADIGNGSSDAGSKKLYDMMDRIRMARHGTKEQPPEIKAERLMPA